MELIAVMELGVIRGSIDPHFVNDFEPAVAESTQGIGVTLVLLTVMLIVNLGPETTGKTLLSKKMDGVTEMFVTSPALVAVAVFSGTLGDRSSSAKTLQILSLAAKSLPIVANFGEQARSDLGSGAGQGTEQIMIGMTSKELFDSLAIERQLLFDGKKHLH